jgi:hypothetical protein
MGPETHRTIGCNNTLDGGPVLPAFSVKVADFFPGIDVGEDAKETQRCIRKGEQKGARRL